MNRKEFDVRRRRQVGQTPRLLTLEKVIEMTSISKTKIYYLIAQGLFPRPVRVGARTVRWIESEVVHYILTRPRAGSERSRR